jgi:hypothetical protein
MNNWNWPLIGHTIVGVIITGSQAIAVTYPANTQLVNMCHIITLITIQIGVSLGVWQSQQISFSLKKTALLDRAKNLVDIISRKSAPQSLDETENQDEMAREPAPEPKKEAATVEVKETVAVDATAKAE